MGGGASWAAALEQAREERETGCAQEKGKREWAERGKRAEQRLGGGKEKGRRRDQQAGPSCHRKRGSGERVLLECGRSG